MFGSFCKLLLKFSKILEKSFKKYFDRLINHRSVHSFIY